MNEGYDEKKITQFIVKQKELEKERKEVAKQIVKNLEDQRQIEKEHLDLVEKHQKYWNNALENTNKEDRERYDDLKNRLKKEEEIRNKITDHIKHIDKEIKIQRKHAI